jgi:hypothetical protein
MLIKLKFKSLAFYQGNFAISNPGLLSPQGWYKMQFQIF